MKRTVKHEIKLEKSTKVILLIMALGICANAFHFTNPIEDAMAGLSYGDKLLIEHSGSINCRGCN